MILLRKRIKDIRYQARVGTSDTKAFEEVIGRRAYQRKWFRVEAGERWLDLGANVGAFSCWAAQQGAIVKGFEPEPNNAKMARSNLELNRLQAEIIEGAIVCDKEKTATSRLYLSNTDYGQWRHSLRKGKSKKYIEVQNYRISEQIEGIDAVKMDIEGVEIDILGTVTDWKSVNKLCLEYHFDVDDSIPLFSHLMGILERSFENVVYGKVPENEMVYKWYPPARIVFAYNQKAQLVNE